YGDRVILKRAKRPEAIFGEPDRLYEFYYMDANAVKELPRTIMEKIKVILRLVVSPEAMNVLCEFTADNGVEPNEWALETKNAIINAKTLNFEVLNNILVERYKLLGGKFLANLKKHREKQYFLASSDAFDFVAKDYADEQIKTF
ncbi:MAG: hypothetical protein MJ152_01470, partial [Clostridia bacterium]|nr:hypothetical protein [Clostridia bacterium]